MGKEHKKALKYEELKKQIHTIFTEEEHKYLQATPILWWDKKRLVRDLTNYLEHSYYLNSIPVESLPAGLQNVLSQRSTKIAGHPHDYTRMPLQPANSLSYSLAKFLEQLTGICRFQILLPSLESLNNDRDGSTLNDPKVQLHHFVLSDDRKRTINVLSCLKHARRTNQLIHTALNTAGVFDKLSLEEEKRVIYHSRHTEIYYSACQAYQLAKSRQGNAVYWLKLFTDELEKCQTYEQFNKRAQAFLQWFNGINAEIKNLILATDLKKIVSEKSQSFHYLYDLRCENSIFRTIRQLIKDNSKLNTVYSMTEEEHVQSLLWFAQASDKAEEDLQKALTDSAYIVEEPPENDPEKTHLHITSSLIEQFHPNEVINFSLTLNWQLDFYLPLLANQVLNRLRETYDFFEYYRLHRSSHPFMTKLVMQMTSDVKTMPQFLVSFFMNVNCPGLGRIEEFCHSLEDLQLLVNCPVLSGSWSHSYQLIAAAKPLLTKNLPTIADWKKFVRHIHSFRFLLYPVMKEVFPDMVHDIIELSDAVALIHDKESSQSLLRQINISKLQTTPFHLATFAHVVSLVDAETQQILLSKFREQVVAAETSSYMLKQFIWSVHSNNHPLLLGMIDKKIQVHYLDIYYNLPQFTFSEAWLRETCEICKGKITTPKALSRFLSLFPHEAEEFLQSQKNLVLTLIEEEKDFWSVLLNIPKPISLEFFRLVKDKFPDLLENKDKLNTLARTLPRTARQLQAQYGKFTIKQFPIGVSPTLGQGLFDSLLKIGDKKDFEETVSCERVKADILGR